MLKSLLQNQRKIQIKNMLYQNCKSLYLPTTQTRSDAET